MLQNGILYFKNKKSIICQNYIVEIISGVLNFNCNKNKEGFQNYIGTGYRGYKNRDVLQQKCLNWTESDNESIKLMAFINKSKT